MECKQVFGAGLLLVFPLLYWMSLFENDATMEGQSTGRFLDLRPWAGVPAVIKRTRDNQTTFSYKSQTNKQKGRQLYLSDADSKRFDWPPTRYVTLDPDVEVSLVFVTGANDFFYKPMLDAISSVQHLAPKSKIVVWDLGFEPDKKQKLESICDVEYRKFNFSAYPPYVNRLRNFAFKPIVIAETMKDYPYLFWMDSSIRITRKLAQIKALIRPQIRSTGGVISLASASHSVFAATAPDIYRFFPSNTKYLRKIHMTGAGDLIIFRTKRVFRSVLLFWVLCALNEKCANPYPKGKKCDYTLMFKGSGYSGCHRYDQSVLNVLLANNNRFKNKYYSYKGKPFIQISRRSYKHRPIKTCQNKTVKNVTIKATML